MGASVGTGDGKRSVDVELNVVPFIDLMSCLASFLLATAVWSAYAQISIKPKGLGRTVEPLQTEEKYSTAILVTENEVWVGHSLGDRRQIAKEGDDYDWDALDEVLKDFRTNVPAAKDKFDIEIAAEDKVMYQSIITAMDTSIANEFRDVGFVDPDSLSVKFKE